MPIQSPTRRPLRARALAYIDALLIEKRAELAEECRVIAQRRAARDELRRQIRWLEQERQADEGRS